MLPSENPRRSVGFRIQVDQADKPNSVVDDHLSRALIAQSLKRHFRQKTDTALHGGKDLAVSPPESPRELASGFFRPQRRLSLSLETSLLAPRASRRTGVTRYHSPRLAAGPCSDFPPLDSSRSDRLAWSACIIPHQPLLFLWKRV